MSNPEIKVLRDELARLIGENKKMYLLNEKLVHVLEEEKREKIEMVMTIDSLERRLKIYENAHAPPSHGSVPAQQKKARSAERSKSSERAEGKTGGPQAWGIHGVLQRSKDVFFT